MYIILYYIIIIRCKTVSSEDSATLINIWTSRHPRQSLAVKYWDILYNLQITSQGY